ncbi:MAG TPA: hypothetical protein PK036_07420, partial [Geobacteraceae bacterium]|nr:hypothetical protein [Geobacteraceae bacterium]
DFIKAFFVLDRVIIECPLSVAPFSRADPLIKIPVPFLFSFFNEQFHADFSDPPDVSQIYLTVDRSEGIKNRTNLEFVGSL